MRKDILNSYIDNLTEHCVIKGKDILEIGCGDGRITSDIARLARHVIAIDSNQSEIAKAQTLVKMPNVKFVHVTQESLLPFPEATFDIVLYSLSLHHIPEAEMPAHLSAATKLLRGDGSIVILEPSDGGSFMYAKEEFGAGSGNERAARTAALAATRGLKGWRRSLPVYFDTLWEFESLEEFIKKMIPHIEIFASLRKQELKSFIERHSSGGRVLLDSSRMLIVLNRES